MKKYFDNILFYLQKSGGGSVHWGELMKRFNVQRDVNFVEPNAQTLNILINTLNLKTALKEVNIPLSILRYFPLTIRIEEQSIFHSSYYRFSNQNGIFNFITVHDFIYERYGSGLSKVVHHQQKRLAIKKAHSIICVSNNTKHDLQIYFPDLIKQKEIAVIHNGVSEDFFVLSEERKLVSKFHSFKKNQYILFVGHRTSYKNFDFAVKVVSSLPESYKMAIVGNALSSNEVYFLENNLKDRYTFLGNVSNSELNELYNLCECLIYPSSYEGFGIPIIEAFKCKCPVVAQDIPILNEIAGDAALLCSGLNIKAFKENILLLSKSNLKNQIIELGFEKAEKFSWDTCFKETSDFYNSIK